MKMKRRFFPVVFLSLFMVSGAQAAWNLIPENEFTTGGNVLVLKTTIENNQVTFRVEKQDGSAFQTGGIMTIRAGDYYGCVANLKYGNPQNPAAGSISYDGNEYAWSFKSGDKFTSKKFDLLQYRELGANKIWYAAVGKPSTPCDNNAPLYYSGPVYLSETASTAEFQGAGSLIKPDSSCYGCDKDDAEMHPATTPTVASTVVFQTRNSSKCEKYVAISANKAIGDVVISVKKWDASPSDNHSYLARLPVTVPVIGDFSTIAVSSMNPVLKSTAISAVCTASEKNTGVKNEVQSTPVETTFANGYTWAGNGSVISGNTGSCTAFGCTKDEAIALDKAALTAFQWQVSDRCKTLNIRSSDPGDDGKGHFSGRLKYKVWSSPTWTYDSYFSSAQNITNLSKTYYVFAIETMGGAIPSGKSIKASCVTSTPSQPQITAGCGPTAGGSLVTDPQVACPH